MALADLKILYIFIPEPFASALLQGSLCISLINEKLQKRIEYGLSRDLKYYEIIFRILRGPVHRVTHTYMCKGPTPCCFSDAI